MTKRRIAAGLVALSLIAPMTTSVSVSVAQENPAPSNEYPSIPASDPTAEAIDADGIASGVIDGMWKLSDVGWVEKQRGSTHGGMVGGRLTSLTDGRFDTRGLINEQLGGYTVYSQWTDEDGAVSPVFRAQTNVLGGTNGGTGSFVFHYPNWTDANGKEHIFNADPVKERIRLWAAPGQTGPGGGELFTIRQAPWFQPGFMNNTDSNDDEYAYGPWFLQFADIFTYEMPTDSMYAPQANPRFRVDDKGWPVDTSSADARSSVSGSVWWETGQSERNYLTFPLSTGENHAKQGQARVITSVLTGEGVTEFEKLTGLRPMERMKKQREILEAHPEYIAETVAAETDDQGRYYARFNNKSWNKDYLYQFVQVKRDGTWVTQPAYSSYLAPIFGNPKELMNIPQSWDGTRHSWSNMDFGLVQQPTENTVSLSTSVASAGDKLIPSVNATPAEGSEAYLQWFDSSGQPLLLDGSPGEKKIPVSGSEPLEDATFTVPSVKGNETYNLRLYVGGTILDAASAAVSVQKTDTPKVEPPTEGGTEVRGTTEPGATVSVTVPNVADPIVVTADENGSFIAPLPEGMPLPAEGIVIVTAKAPEKDSSAPIEAPIAQMAITPRPSVDAVAEGAFEINGFAEPDSTVTITFPDGKQLTTQTYENGRFYFAVEGTEVKEGDEVSFVAQSPGKKPSDPLPVTVSPPLPSFVHQIIELEAGDSLFNENLGGPIPAETIVNTNGPITVDFSPDNGVIIKTSDLTRPGEYWMDFEYPGNLTSRIRIIVWLAKPTFDDRFQPYPGQTFTVPRVKGTIPADTEVSASGPGSATIDQSGELVVTADKDAKPGEEITLTLTYSDGIVKTHTVTVGEDPDRDHDGVPNAEDAYPDNPTAWLLTPVATVYPVVWVRAGDAATSAAPAEDLIETKRVQERRHATGETYAIGSYVPKGIGNATIDSVTHQVSFQAASTLTSGSVLAIPVTVTRKGHLPEQVVVPVRIIAGSMNAEYTPTLPSTATIAAGSGVQLPVGSATLPGNTTFAVTSQLPGEWIAAVDQATGTVTIYAPFSAQVGDKATVELEVTYPDGTKDTLTSTVTVDTATAQPYYEQTKLRAGTEETLPLWGVDKLPKGTTFSLPGDLPAGLTLVEIADNGELTATADVTAIPGLLEIPVAVTYPDGTGTTLTANVQVLSPSGHRTLAEDEKLATVTGTTAAAGITRTNPTEDVTYTVTDKPAGWSVDVRADGSIHAQPPQGTAPGTKAKMTVQATYPDGSTNTVPVVIEVAGTTPGDTGGSPGDTGSSSTSGIVGIVTGVVGGLLLLLAAGVAAVGINPSILPPQVRDMIAPYAPWINGK